MGVACSFSSAPDKNEKARAKCAKLPFFIVRHEICDVLVAAVVAVSEAP